MDAEAREALAERYRTIRSRTPPEVTLVAVSKTRSVEEIKALYDLGHRAFGENYPQELREKQPLLPADIEWHFIGHLQTNKVKYIAPFVHLVHGVDSVKLLDELDRRAAQNGRVQEVLLQVHIAEEDTKHGFGADELLALAGVGWTWKNLNVRGLMGMASNTQDSTQVKHEFDGLRALFDKLAVTYGPHFDTLSMGMSADAPEALAAGSTLLRVGTAIFGERDYSAG
jgi:PLP dependent protein